MARVKSADTVRYCADTVRPLTQLPSILVFWYFLIRILKYCVAATLTRLHFYEYFSISKYSLASRGGYLKHFLQEKAVEATKQKKKKRRKKPKPEEQEGMPQHQHCPPEKRRGDKNPECHEEQQKYVA
jgi:hypothetical protein